MKTRLLPLLGLTVALLGSVARAAAPVPAVLYVRCGKLMTSADAPLKGPTTLVVTDGRITAIGDNLPVPAGAQQQEVRKIDVVRREPWEAGGQRVALQVVDGDERAAGCERQPLAGAGTDEQAADQPGARCGGDGGKIRRAQSGGLQHRCHHRRQVTEMRPRGDLGHYAAEWRGRGELAEHARGQHGAIRRQHGHGGLVAGGFYREDRPRGCTAPLNADVRSGGLLFIQVRH